MFDRNLLNPAPRSILDERELGWIDLSGGEVSNIDFSEMRLDGEDLRDLIFVNCDFSFADLNALLTGSIFIDCKAYRADVAYASFDADFDQDTLPGAFWGPRNRAHKKSK